MGKNTEFLYLVLNYAKCVIIIIHVQLYSVWLTAILYHTLPDTVVVGVVIVVVIVDVVVVVIVVVVDFVGGCCCRLLSVVVVCCWLLLVVVDVVVGWCRRYRRRC